MRSSTKFLKKCVVIKKFYKIKKLQVNTHVQDHDLIVTILFPGVCNVFAKNFQANGPLDYVCIKRIFIATMFLVP